MQLDVLFLPFTLLLLMLFLAVSTAHPSESGRSSPDSRGTATSIPIYHRIGRTKLLFKKTFHDLFHRVHILGTTHAIASSMNNMVESYENLVASIDHAMPLFVFDTSLRDCLLQTKADSKLKAQECIVDLEDTIKDHPTYPHGLFRIPKEHFPIEKRSREPHDALARDILGHYCTISLRETVKDLARARDWFDTSQMETLQMLAAHYSNENYSAHRDRKVKEGLPRILSITEAKESGDKLLKESEVILLALAPYRKHRSTLNPRVSSF